MDELTRAGGGAIAVVQGRGLELRPRPGRLRCPYCHESALGGLVRCECGARFHRVCATALAVCSTLGCGRDVTPAKRVLHVRSESGCGTIAFAWGASVVLLFVVLGGMTGCPLLLYTDRNLWREQEPAAVVCLRASARPTTPTPVPMPTLLPMPTPMPVPTFEDLRLTIAPVAPVSRTSDILVVRARVQSLARGAATLCLHREHASFVWEQASPGGEWCPLDLPACCREGWSPIGERDFASLEPGEWVDLERVVHRDHLNEGARRVRLTVELEPSLPALERHFRRAPYFFAVESPFALEALRRRVRGALGGSVVSNELALER